MCARVIISQRNEKRSGESFVRAVAQDTVCTLLAGAEIHGAVFFGGIGNW